MKFTTKLILYWASVFLLFLLGMILVMMAFGDVQFKLWQLLIAFIINGIIPPAIITSFFYKRLDYMESENLAPPNFKGQKKAELSFTPKTSSPFDELLQKVDREYIISYSDREKKVLKFRTDCRMLSWGIGGYVNMIDSENVSVVVYPIFENSRRQGLILDQILTILNSIFNP